MFHSRILKYGDNVAMEGGWVFVWSSRMCVMRKGGGGEGVVLGELYCMLNIQ